MELVPWVLLSPSTMAKVPTSVPHHASPCSPPALPISLVSLCPTLAAHSPSVSFSPLQPLGESNLLSPVETWLPASGTGAAQSQTVAETSPGHSLHPQNTRSPPESHLPFAALPGQLSLLGSPGGIRGGRRGVERLDTEHRTPWKKFLVALRLCERSRERLIRRQILIGSMAHGVSVTWEMKTHRPLATQLSWKP